MINFSNSLGIEKISLSQKFIALILALFVSEISLPIPFNYFRPDLFLVLLIYFSLHSHEDYFSMVDACIFGLLANFCYPIFFGFLSFLYISIFLVLKIYNPRLRNYSDFMMFITFFLLVFVSKLFILLAYNNSITGNFFYMLSASVISSFLVLAILASIFRPH